MSQFERTERTEGKKLTRQNATDLEYVEPVIKNIVENQKEQQSAIKRQYYSEECEKLYEKHKFITRSLQDNGDNSYSGPGRPKHLHLVGKHNSLANPRSASSQTLALVRDKSCSLIEVETYLVSHGQVACAGQKVSPRPRLQIQLTQHKESKS